MCILYLSAHRCFLLHVVIVNDNINLLYPLNYPQNELKDHDARDTDDRKKGGKKGAAGSKVTDSSGGAAAGAAGGKRKSLSAGGSAGGDAKRAKKA